MEPEEDRAFGGRGHSAAAALSQEDTADRLRMILNSVRDGIIALDLQGCIDGVNPAIEAMFGYSEEELNGHDIGILYEETPTAEQVKSYLAYIRGRAGEASNSKFRGKITPFERCIGVTATSHKLRRNREGHN